MTHFGVCFIFNEIPLSLSEPYSEGATVLEKNSNTTLWGKDSHPTPLEEHSNSTVCLRSLLVNLGSSPPSVLSTSFDASYDDGL